MEKIILELKKLTQSQLIGLYQDAHLFRCGKLRDTKNVVINDEFINKLANEVYFQKDDFMDTNYKYLVNSID